MLALVSDAKLPCTSVASHWMKVTQACSLTNATEYASVWNIPVIQNFIVIC